MCEERSFNNKCKLSFKGVETFLRKIAFNLGNTPSQTEVKIISCIPIDVTDLQQKIANLEKALEEAKCCKTVQDTNTVAQVGLCDQKLSGACPARLAPSLSNSCELCDIARFSPRHSPCHSPCHSPRQTPCHSPHPRGCHTPRPAPCHSARSPPCFTPDSCGLDLGSVPDVDCTCCPSDMSDILAPLKDTECRRSIFRRYKKKGSKKKGKCKSQLVYYAQTPKGPFTAYSEGRKTICNVGPKSDDETLGRNYITDMINKQYISVPVALEPSMTSQFSTPVCRDVDLSALNGFKLLDSDLCSCFCDTPRNTNCNKIPADDIRNDSPETRVDNSDFYDSSLYDIVPVKENNAEAAYYIMNENCKKKLPKRDVIDAYFPERNLPKSRYHPFVVNYSTIEPAPCRYPKRTSAKLHQKKDKSPKLSATKDQNKETTIRGRDSSKSYSVNCSPVYARRFLGATGAVMQEPIATVHHKNAECLTINMNDTECQTITSQSVQIDNNLFEEKKTELTLKQIKDILQSVLTEVKTKALSVKVPDNKPTKDAVVQKGVSRGNMPMPGCSSLLNSYTYSPYNMEPFSASCSNQINQGTYCLPNIPPPPTNMQHFPVFIQTTGRNMCSTCYRNSSHKPKATHMKNATTIATNTDSKESNKETETLIKEIYKSLAVNLEMPARETSISEYEVLKSTPRQSQNRSISRGSFIKELLKKPTTSSLRQIDLKTSTLASKPGSNTVSSRSQIDSSTDTEQRKERFLRNKRLENYLEAMEENRSNKILEEREFESFPETTSDDGDVESHSDNASVASQKELPKNSRGKEGLFSKMFKRFGLKSKIKEEAVEIENEEDESDDSDDYQTIYSKAEEARAARYAANVASTSQETRRSYRPPYSYEMTTPPGPITRDIYRHSKHKVPYLEQEYRREWNESLMFNENRPRHSTDSPRLRDPMQMKPIYWQNYDARSAFVGYNNNRVCNFKAPNPSACNAVERKASTRLPRRPKLNVANKGLSWLKNQKLGVKCGKDWKKFVLES